MKNKKNGRKVGNTFAVKVGSSLLDFWRIHTPYDFCCSDLEGRAQVNWSGFVSIRT